MLENVIFNQLVGYTEENGEMETKYVRVVLNCTKEEEELCKQNQGIPLNNVSKEYLKLIGLDVNGNKN